jgi:OOP family OmpA-OmpF porin
MVYRNCRWIVNKETQDQWLQVTLTPESLCVADLGVRYMFNNKFGLKADFGYNNFEGKKQFSWFWH